MPVRLVPPLAAEIYLEYDQLPDVCRPCWVVRDEGATLVTIDPRTTKLEAIQWCVDNLTQVENDAYRAAFAAPPTGQPLPDRYLTSELVVPIVPPPLRLRGCVHASTWAEAEMESDAHRLEA